jgi:hypothetical protein
MDALSGLMRRLAAIPLVMLPFSSVVVAKVPEVVSICELAKSPDFFDGKLVRVRAIYVTDLVEHSALIDDQCRGTSFPLYEPENGSRHRSIGNFDRAVLGDVQDLKLRMFEIEFSARFHRNDASSGGRLEMTRVWTYARWPT